MKWLLLIALVACSTTKNENIPDAEESAGESDAKPVSPYTVEPCTCMKIFMPVCAGGRNFGNSCEAECAGHKTWTDGSCAKKKK